MNRAVLCLIAVLLASLASGCSSGRAHSAKPWNPWETYYAPPRIASAEFASRPEVAVRVVDLNQFKAGTDAIKRYLDDRKMAPEDMSLVDAIETRRLMLDALRVREDPSTLVVVGSSSFTSPFAARADDPQLAEFAKHKGADIVVMATEYCGEREGTGLAPVMSSSTSSANGQAWGSGGWASGIAWGSSNSVSWVPVARRYQQWSTVATYFRRLSPEERASVEARFKGESPTGG